MAKAKRALDLVRPHLLSLQPYESVDPPDVIAKRIGLPESELVKLDANENPYGPSPRVAKAMPGVARVHLYPDPAQIAMRNAIAEYVGISADHIVVGNGSDEIIDLIFRAVLEPGDSVAVCTPTFGMYDFTAQVCGAVGIAADRDANFAVQPESVLAALTSRTKIIAVASPNNPSGNSTPPSVIERLLESDRLVMVDEAYVEFGGTSVAEWAGTHPNLVVLRTLSKWGGLAGLRVGYGLMAADLADLLLRAKPPYNVNQAAEAALLASLSDIETLNRRAQMIVSERERMIGALADLDGVSPLPSDANFVLCRMPDGRGKVIYERLARQGVFVRYYRRPSLADYLRISVGTPEQTARLIEALSAALAE